MNRRIRWDQETQWLKAGMAGNGAFLNVNTPDGRLNPMTIGWGQIGIVWGRPIFSVYVRQSRYTYDCLLHAESFTISVPRLGELADELMLCGTKSGRDLDKVAACGLTVTPSQSVDTPILSQCGLHYECAIVARHQFVGTDFASKTIHKKYESKDLHQITLGEILTAYVTEKPSDG